MVVYNGNYTFITDNNFNVIDIAYRDFSFDYGSVLEDTQEVQLNVGM